MPRPTEPDANENVFRMTTEEIEEWMAEGDAERARFRQRMAERRKKHGDVSGEQAA